MYNDDTLKKLHTSTLSDNQYAIQLMEAQQYLHNVLV